MPQVQSIPSHQLFQFLPVGVPKNSQYPLCQALPQLFTQSHHFHHLGQPLYEYRSYHVIVDRLPHCHPLPPLPPLIQLLPQSHQSHADVVPHVDQLSVLPQLPQLPPFQDHVPHHPPHHPHALCQFTVRLAVHHIPPFPPFPQTHADHSVHAQPHHTPPLPQAPPLDIPLDHGTPHRLPAPPFHATSDVKFGLAHHTHNDFLLTHR